MHIYMHKRNIGVWRKPDSASICVILTEILNTVT